MNRIKILFPVILISISCVAQEYNSALGIKIIPAFANQIMDYQSEARLGISIGAEYEHKFVGDNLFIETGLYYYDHGQKIDLSYMSGSYPVYWVSFIRANYLQIPISLSFKYSGFVIGAGSNYNLYLNHTEYVDLGNKITPYKGDPLLPRFLVGFQLYAGYEHELLDEIILHAELFYSQTFKIRYVNYGIGLGVSYVLN